MVAGTVLGEVAGTVLGEVAGTVLGAGAAVCWAGAEKSTFGATEMAFSFSTLKLGLT